MASSSKKALSSRGARDNFKEGDKSTDVYSFEFIKQQIKPNIITSLDNDVLSKFCGKLQLKTSGNKEDLIARLSPLQDEELMEKRMTFINRKFKFKTSLLRDSVPPSNANWKFDSSLLPRIGQKEIDAYQSQKRQGRKGQYRKGYRMFQSRKMKTIKVLQGDGLFKYVKASVLKSFSSDVTRTVTVLFEGNVPKKAFCECPVGACGLCCHAICVLLQLKHFNETGKFLLALTCTQKLQKWHRPSIADKARSKAKAASHIRLKYFRNVRSARKSIDHKRSKRKVEKSSSESVNDIDKSDWFIRDVGEISKKVQNGLQQVNVDVSNHFLNCLNKHKITSGLSQHLGYTNAYRCQIIRKEHNYANSSACFNEELLMPKFKGKAEDIWHSSLVVSQSETVADVPWGSSKTTCSLFSTEKSKHLLDLVTQSEGDEIISLKLPKYEDITMIGVKNYVNVAQGSKEWFANRIGIITASKLPTLLGMNGQKEFESAWFCINNKLDESTYRPKQFRNFKRGIMFEKQALADFVKVSGAPVSSCGFFKHPEDPRYGASPDGIGEAFCVEVKTRAENSNTPLEKITGSHLVQTNFQMACVNGDITFLQSYLPEKDISNFYFVKRNDLLINVIKGVTDQMLQNNIFTEWHYDEHSHLKRLGEQLLGTAASFERLRPLRSWINSLAKEVKRVSFC